MSVDNALLAAHVFINLLCIGWRIVGSPGRQKRAGFGVGGGSNMVICYLRRVNMKIITKHR